MREPSKRGTLVESGLSCECAHHVSGLVVVGGVSSYPLLVVSASMYRHWGRGKLAAEPGGAGHL